MPTPRLLPPRYLKSLAAMAAPPVAVLGALVLGRWVTPGPALVAGAVAVVALAVLLFLHLRRVASVADYLDRLTGGGNEAAAVPPPAGAAAGATAELHRAVTDAGRLWSARRRELEAVVAANEAVIAGLPDPLLMLDRERRILRANQAAETAFGPSLAGRDLMAVLRIPGLVEAVDGALASGVGRAVEFTLPVPVERSFSALVEPLSRPIADGTVALLSLHDLTQMKRTDRMRADFVANASHEMRTPLSTLVGFIETLRGPARDDADARDRFLAIMHDQALRMSRLVADLLSLGRIELNEHTPPTGRAVLGDVIRAVADGLEFKAAQKGMTIELDAPGPDGKTTPLDALPTVIGDTDEISQVFQNLIDNAIKYGRPGSAIRIANWAVEPLPAVPVTDPRAGRRLDRAAVAVAVMDSGDGIAREHLPRLTERFYRVDTARSRELGGTGLGLAIVKHILNRHRGALDIDSVQGEGSTFTVYLPAAAAGRGRSPPKPS